MFVRRTGWLGRLAVAVVAGMVGALPLPAGTPAHAVTQQVLVENWSGLGNWTAVSGSWAGNGELQTYPPGQARVAHGQLVLSADRLADGRWVSARLHSTLRLSGKFSLTASVKPPRGQGLWPALWLLDVENSASWPLCGEIDMFEAVNLAGTAHVNVHLGNPLTRTHVQAPVSVPVDPSVFHDYRVDVDPFAADPSVTFFVDGARVQQVRRSQLPAGTVWPFTPTAQLRVVVNLAVGGSWPGAPDASTPAHAQMLVGPMTLTRFS